ncbi:response regulator transcription factor [Oscillatoria sp. FACHB-1407]|uniref:response regulator transcription factor n=1 Tax=Oscillatoria sp. FACHB-1407 TaxID=2692847 RepID=UPI001682805D|nr:response regulator transcription factor [Oscillatoria sp. FACHB-1407]MBD2459634.1 response regulator transcription factor [Oscillatoria sp. FACHB-1407]
MKKILILEDEAQSREMFLRCLTFEEFSSFAAERDSRGVELADAQPQACGCELVQSVHRG